MTLRGWLLLCEPELRKLCAELSVGRFHLNRSIGEREHWRALATGELLGHRRGFCYHLQIDEVLVHPTRLKYLL